MSLMTTKKTMSDSEEIIEKGNNVVKSFANLQQAMIEYFQAIAPRAQALTEELLKIAEAVKKAEDARALRNDEEDNDEHEIGCTCIFCLPGF